MSMKTWIETVRTADEAREVIAALRTRFWETFEVQDRDPNFPSSADHHIIFVAPFPRKTEDQVRYTDEIRWVCRQIIGAMSLRGIKFF